MRDPDRIDPMLAELAVLWKKYPDLRLGQLLENLGVQYYTEDDTVLDAIRHVTKEGL